MDQNPEKPQQKENCEIYFEEFKKCANSFDQNSFENENEERREILAKCKVAFFF